MEEKRKEAGTWFPELSYEKKLENQKKFLDQSKRLKVNDYVFANTKSVSNYGNKSYDIQRGALYQIFRINATESPTLYYLKTTDLAENKELQGAYYREVKK